SVIIPELKFSDVQMHVLAAHLMECADNAALEDRPETLNRLSVDRANYILALGMINEGVWVILIQAAIAHPLVSAEQTNLIRYRLMYECGQGRSADIVDHAGDYVALALYRTDNWRFAGTNAAGSMSAAALVFVPVLSEPANKGFV